MLKPVSNQFFAVSMAYLCKPIRLKVASTLAFLLFYQLLIAQADTAALSKFLDRNKKEFGGDVAVVVYYNNAPFYKKEIGELKTNTQVPIYAASQWLTAAAVLSVVSEGKLELDEKIVRFLPLLTKYSKIYITLRHCLNHQTGLEAPKNSNWVTQKRRYENLAEEVNTFITKLQIETNPGEAFAYSGVGFNLAGHLMELALKKPFDRIMQERITRAIGMKNTSFSNENGAPNPSVGAISTADDYIKFLLMLQNKGQANNKQILPADAVELLLKTQLEASTLSQAPNTVKGYDYAFGNWVSHNEGVTHISPGMVGVWPFMNANKKYVAILVTKTTSNDNKQGLYQSFMQQVEAALP
ncbi:MAG: class A beta-lactamase-related serine hydrolase [Bacteroidetes bacterium]|nr:MAG: class A beta-lactamase-related serine hydrolase [Bacteroidota bacterium]